MQKTTFRHISIAMEWLFDFIIFGFLIAGLAAMVYFFDDQTFLSAVIAVPWFVVFFGSFIEPRWLVVRQETVDLSPTPTKSFRVAIVSDVQAGRYKGARYLQKMVDRIVYTKPDAIFLLGDFVSYDAEQATAFSPFKNITATIPTYGILGNHDYQLGSPKYPANIETADHIVTILESYGVKMLRNRGAQISDGLYLAGLEEVWTQKANLAAALNARPDNGRTILLVHNPDYIKMLSKQQNIDLVLSGHTHGGQIRLPFLGSVSPIPNDLGRAYDKGWFTYQGQRLFVTSGAGESGPRARLFNPPEIVLLTIRY